MELLKNSRVVWLAAFACAALAVLFAYAYQSRRGQQETQAQARIAVAVANQSVPAGTIITGEMVAVKEFPTAAVPPGALRDPMQAVGQVARKTMDSEEILTSESIVERSAALGPAYVLPSEMRAITISTDAVSGIAGFVKPGDRVDVLATFNRGPESITRVVLQDVEVLAVGKVTVPSAPTTPAGGPADTTRAPASTPVTLAVTVPEAERLVLADARGKIRLALRPATGAGYTMTSGATESQVSGLRLPSSAQPRTPPRVAIASAPPPASRDWYPPVRPPSPVSPPLLSVIGPAPPIMPIVTERQITVVRGTVVEKVGVPISGAGAHDGRFNANPGPVTPGERAERLPAQASAPAP